MKRKVYLTKEQICIDFPKIKYYDIDPAILAGTFPKKIVIRDNKTKGGYITKYDRDDIERWAKENGFSNTLNRICVKYFLRRQYIKVEEVLEEDYAAI